MPKVISVLFKNRFKCYVIHFRNIFPIKSFPTNTILLYNFTSTTFLKNVQTVFILAEKRLVSYNPTYSLV